MSRLCETVCSELGWTPDSAKLESMKAANEKDLAKLDASVKDAEENLGDIEVRDSHLAKAEYLYNIGESQHPLSLHRSCINCVLHSLQACLKSGGACACPDVHVAGRFDGIFPFCSACVCEASATQLVNVPQLRCRGQGCCKGGV